jgi:aldehyde dehydrogenase (NAD+)
MAERILAEKDELAKLDALAMGRPVDGYFDANYAAVHFNYFSEAGYAQGHTSLNTPGFMNMSLRQPFGVVAIIIPWNAPLVFFSKKVAPAVAAGNCVVLKSSEKAPLTVRIHVRITSPFSNKRPIVLESIAMDSRVRLSSRCY